MDENKAIEISELVRQINILKRELELIKEEESSIELYLIQNPIIPILRLECTDDFSDGELKSLIILFLEEKLNELKKKIRDL